MASMRTPLRRVRGLGSAKEGTDHFWKQRLTALANVPLVLFALGLIVSLAGQPHEVVRSTLANPFVALVLILFLVSVLTHMKLGMQVVIEDYVHGEGAKILLIALNIFFTFAVGAASVFALLKIAFGG
ncbi:succinate dehydrogenase, hydrophobic membrane anchor protein [Aliihoeflea aestuarii]|jgi:succinate dehydrogenase / fumarate reductase, membrane anchor subunit|uniref:succinate dehydrogenase, hydrophobic membrane anchor protein n=1 Tax=Aliihoeflea aestuarii TaxID=453840 RepID=UPI0020924EE0|nr:succinate dehydrogenase, hydrophobic membrane anchor protein [Aliihoeflea aestuarii]MCO6391392.1 succinate dehydrogenase, hydrophobic membrane anchor protein [Aliihoeflea aestuarii]